MLSTEPIQHVKHSCPPSEFESYMTGEKTFDIKINDPNFVIREGDLITLEEINPETEEPTGRRITRKVGISINTKRIENITNDEIASRGITICSLIQPEHGSLYALYSKYFTMSLMVDRQDERDGASRDRNWEVFGDIAYTPIGLCPDFASTGILDTFSLDKWPEGRYFITVLIHLSEDHEVSVRDLIIMSVIQSELDKDQVDFVELAPEGLFAGTSIELHTNRKVNLLPVDEVNAATAIPMNSQETQDYDDMLSEEEMRRLIDEARSRGEPNLHLISGDEEDRQIEE